MFKKIDENTIEETIEVKKKHKLDDILRKKKSAEDNIKIYQNLIKGSQDEIIRLNVLLDESEKLGLKIQEDNNLTA